MQDHTTAVSRVRIGLCACCLFIVLAACIIPYPGIQNDETIFAAPIYHHADNNLQHAQLSWRPPLMVVDYIGSLKTLLYWPILAVFDGGVWTLRLPVVLLGALSAFIFFQLAILSVGRIAAILAVFMLATDPVYLLTNTIDWGPVALEHVLLIAGCGFLFRFGSRAGSDRTLLALGFFCFGLALWNKAVFVWALFGLTAGALVVFWPELRRCLTLRNLTYSAGAFLLGAVPLIAYNIHHRNVTLGNNAQLDVASLPGKWIQIERALNGSSLFGFMVSDESSPRPKNPSSWRGRTALWIREHFGEHRQTGFYYVCGALLLAVPWWWRSRAARFSFVFTAASWAAMASTHNAGASVHHVVLLWPFPILFAATALAELPWRSVTIVVGIGIVAMNLLVLNQYMSQFERNGPAGSFTDAIFPLSTSLSETPGMTPYLLDWGIAEPVTFLHQGRLKFSPTDYSSDPDATEIQRMLTDPQAEFITHVAGQEVFPRRGHALLVQAEASGYRKESLGTIPDSNGRPVFERFRLVRK